LLLGYIRPFVSRNSDLASKKTTWIFFLSLNAQNQPRQRARPVASGSDPQLSSPRIVPVLEAKRSVSIPMRWSIETKRFGNG
jgi:hypothetical protein